jgi:hypothetical protein
LCACGNVRPPSMLAYARSAPYNAGAPVAADADGDPRVRLRSLDG